MKLQYDFVFLTNTPSFYKVNLCNEIAKTHSLLLVLYGYGSEAVNTNLRTSQSNLFDYVFLYEEVASERNKWKTFHRLIKLVNRISYKKILYSGWFVPEYNLLAFFTPIHKNCVICESSAMGSTFKGIKGWIKRLIINRMGTALPSGEPHRDIFTAIGYKGEIYLTGGVGIFNKQPKEASSQTRWIGDKSYLYVGRLIDCKNLHFLIDQFNESGKSLTIVGIGELEAALKNRAKSNIRFLGFIDNKKLKEIYQAHDVFILPSKFEPWGLVVEEAIYWGLPVIASNHVGSAKDMVEKLQTGCLFTYNDSQSFQMAMKEIESHYDMYYKNVLKVDFEKRDALQVKAYTQLVNI